ncbi:hypothetical protein [Chryseobacterium koreense]|uniref:BioF2-like acetyltransferase domain-containing protein n=1 Tax=Chryseobacterium koreense CCUG 49689 TaxID=1304281 RepID=A0A0J7J3J7_9FLAO|nr:hypothetical protein [Chryseobacterium koreense]KMQ72589.1 hypothetical protein ACM44_00360 [Chryseobacterium koreense CCUG 49689]MBB5332975.1 hypothetical protein [Chryseobacterium koreense]
MINKLKYHEIDFQKYSHCIENSVQKNFHARMEILDELCEKWELLIFEDYRFVMPVPIKEKFGFRFVVMPLFCQQLGIFGPEKNPVIEQKFLDYLQKHFRILTYSFNFQNSFDSKLKTKKNYWIQPTEYLQLRKHYFKGRKSTVKTAQYLHFKEFPLSQNIDFINNNFKGLDKKNDQEKFLRFLHFLDERKILRIFGSCKDSDLTNLAIVIEEETNFSLLGLINDERFRDDNGASFLIDRILKEHISEKSFSFMGGNIRGIEVFFKSFGSQLQEYAVIENSVKDLMAHFFKK